MIATNVASIAPWIITGIGAPLFVWALQNTFKTLKRFNALAIKFVEFRKDTEAKVSTVCKDVEALKESGKATDGKITRVEDAIIDIRAAVQRSDEQFTAIMAELKVLPTVIAKLETFSVAIAAIVPRNEVDSRIQATEHRLSLIEQRDIRGAK